MENKGKSVDYYDFKSGWYHSGVKGKTYNDRYKVGTNLPKEKADYKAACMYVCEFEK